MLLSRIISLSESEVNEMIEKFLDGDLETMKINKNTSWSGQNSKESFVNEWDKGVQVVLFIKNADKNLFKKITDLKNCDAGIEDILKYDEYRNINELNMKVDDISDGREDVGYIEIELSNK
jgi:hypothetical protein